MRAALILIPLLALSLSASAQRSSEMGVMLGVTYYSGDLNPSGHFKQGLMHRAVGLLYRRNLSSRWSMRYFALYGKVSGSDATVDRWLARQRQLNFESTIMEGSAMFELNFFDYIASDNRRYYTPTVFAGFGMFRMNPQGTVGDTGIKRDLRLERNEGQLKEYSRIQPTIPFGVGFRLKFSSRLLVSGEWSMRKTWTDYLDDVSTVYRGAAGSLANGYQSSGYQRGDSQTNDWYSFAGINLTYRFGHKPNACYFDRVNRKQTKKRQSRARKKSSTSSKVAN